jgi:hypothetical protein
MAGETAGRRVGVDATNREHLILHAGAGDVTGRQDVGHRVAHEQSGDHGEPLLGSQE